MDKKEVLECRLADNQVALFYLGQEGFLIKYHDKYILIDPYLSDYVDQNCCSETVKWVRNYPAPIEAKELDFVDYVLCTHAHFDHADPDTLSVIAKVNSKAKFYASAGITSLLESCGIESNRIIGMHDGETLTLCEGITATAIKAAHEEFHIDEDGNYLELGYKFTLGNTSIFHAGDGCPYDGLENVLASVKDFCKGRLIAVFGCGGDRDPIKRPIMGKIGLKEADFVVFTSDNPRTENPGAIINEILAGAHGSQTPYVVIESRREAIVYALEHSKKGDVIVLAGKGHETYQEINGIKHHLDEREEVAQWLSGKH